MESGHFKNRFWLVAILTLLLDVFSCQANGLRDSSSQKSTHQSALVVREHAKQDPYWKYYQDCDRWGIELVKPARASSAELPQKSTCEGRTSYTRRPQASPFQAVKYTRPKGNFRGQPAAGYFTLKFSSLKRSMLEHQRIINGAFEQRLLPGIKFLEFVSVESMTYEEFYLPQPQVGVQSRLPETISWVNDRTGLNRFAENWFAKVSFYLQRANFISEKMRGSLASVLQKSARLFETFSNSLEN